MHARRPRRIRDGDSYTVDDERDNVIELETPEQYPEPPIEIQGEPWGWTKPGPKPRGWREDGDYGGQNRDDPGPLDGRWPDESD